MNGHKKIKSSSENSITDSSRVKSEKAFEQ
jgi:hypothetical protein